MKQCFYNQVWQPIKKLVKQIVSRRKDDNDQFNDPYLIF
jgi:hypothetical protein